MSAVSGWLAAPGISSTLRLLTDAGTSGFDAAAPCLGYGVKASCRPVCEPPGVGPPAGM